MKTVLILLVPLVGFNQINRSSAVHFPHEYINVRTQAPYRIEVYSMPFCGHCEYVRKQLEALALPFESINILWKSARYKEMLERTNGVNGAPHIFVNDHYIGSRRDFDDHLLDKLDAIKSGLPVTLRVKNPFFKPGK